MEETIPRRKRRWHEFECSWCFSSAPSESCLTQSFPATASLHRTNHVRPWIDSLSLPRAMDSPSLSRSSHNDRLPAGSPAFVPRNRPSVRRPDGSEQGLRSGGWFVVLHISYDTQYILYTLYYSKNKNYLLSDWNMLHVHRSKE